MTSYLNTTTNPVYDVRLGLTAYATDDRAARTVRPLNSTRFPVVHPGETVSTMWQVDIPLSAASGTYHLVGRAAYQRSPGATQPIFETGGLTRATLAPAFDSALDPDFIGLNTGDSRDTKLQITNHAARPVTIVWHHVRLPSTNPAFTLNPADGTLTVPAGGTASATLTAVAAANATGSTPGPARVDLTASSAGQPETRAGSVTLTVLWYPGAQPSLAATYNNAGITDDADVTAATFDGGVASYSAQGLAAVGLTPGATVNHDGQTFTWPNVPPAQLDNTATDGQVIATSGSGAKIGFLGAGCCGIQTGTLYITYTDGSIARAPLTFADWWTDQPVPGSDIVATSPGTSRRAGRTPTAIGVCYRDPHRWTRARRSSSSRSPQTSTCTSSPWPSAKAGPDSQEPSGRVRSSCQEERTMSRKFVAAVSAVVVGASLSVWGQGVASSLPAAGTAAAATPELSTTTRLSDRREVAAGTRAYSIGFEDGRFYANGWHITGEMGGVWTPPLKLVDGVWFGLDGQWVGPATKFSSGWGYTRYDLPDTAGLKVERTDVVPDGRRGALFGLKITNPGAARTAKLSVDAHSELMGQYPWGFTGVTPNASDNIPDKGSYDGQHLAFTDDGALPRVPAHHYAALVGTSLKPDSGVIGEQFWGPQPGHRCTGTEPGAPADPKPSPATTARSATAPAAS